ncbi:MAG: hypothetical protein QXZ40_00035 [Candidatus Micrarchaeia archaeon]
MIQEDEIEKREYEHYIKNNKIIDFLNSEFISRRKYLTKVPTFKGNKLILEEVKSIRYYDEEFALQPPSGDKIYLITNRIHIPTDRLGNYGFCEAVRMNRKHIHKVREMAKGSGILALPEKNLEATIQYSWWSELERTHSEIKINSGSTIIISGRSVMQKDELLSSLERMLSQELESREKE